jgi:hypothetical protein
MHTPPPDLSALGEKLDELLAGCRPVSAATLAILQETKNEWLQRRPTSEMQSPFFATLAWMFVQIAPQAQVVRASADLERFRNAVLDWGAANVSADQVAAATAIIAQTLGLAAPPTPTAPATNEEA